MKKYLAKSIRSEGTGMQLFATVGENRFISSLIKKSSDYLNRTNHHFFMSGFLILTLVLLIEDKLTANKEIVVHQITPCLYSGMWCKSTNKQQKIAILFPKKITYLKSFPVQIQIQHKEQVQQMQLQFSMRGMQMAMHRFTLKQLKKKKLGKDKFWQTDVV